MIEHELIDLFVAYAMKRTNTDIHMDIFYGLLFSHLLLFSFLIFSLYIPISSDSIVFLFITLYLCDATIFGQGITFAYKFSSACRLLFIGFCVLGFLTIRFLKYYHVFHVAHYFLSCFNSFLSRIVFTPFSHFLHHT